MKSDEQITHRRALEAKDRHIRILRRQRDVARASVVELCDTVELERFFSALALAGVLTAWSVSRG